ncbi:MAG TPA: hypothetical protein VEG68_18350, partial [Terriglobales bacterium]|nr:hypothetical protein [Terriglobales bacterium]
IAGVTSEALARRIQEAGHDARYVPSFGDAADAVAATADEGDMILTLGAGNVSQLGPLILQKLQTAKPVAAGLDVGSEYPHR